jgi:hypothetical protein
MLNIADMSDAVVRAAPQIRLVYAFQNTTDQTRLVQRSCLQSPRAGSRSQAGSCCTPRLKRICRRLCRGPVMWEADKYSPTRK